MPEDMAPQSVTPPAPGEAGVPPFTTEQVLENAATAAANIVDTALATPEGQAAQAAAQIAAGAEAVGLPNTMPTAETAVVDVSSSLAQSGRGAVRVVASDAPQATAWPAPDQSEAFAFSNQSGASPELAAAAAISSHAQAEQVAQAAAKLSTNKANVIIPTPYTRAAMKNVGDAIMSGTDNGETPRAIGANTIAQARMMVEASQAEGDTTSQPTAAEAPIQNAALDAVVTEAFGDPATHTVENAAVNPPMLEQPTSAEATPVPANPALDAVLTEQYGNPDTKIVDAAAGPAPAPTPQSAVDKNIGLTQTYGPENFNVPPAAGGQSAAQGRGPGR